MAFSKIHVVAAVIEDATGRVLISQRPPGKSLAGNWEFPGGKLHSGESRLGGLARELEEELGIRLDAARPLIRYRHVYPEREVDLDAWRVTRWYGEPHGCEGQGVAWHVPAVLREVALLPADATIVNALRLPSWMLVTPPKAPEGDGRFLDALEAYAQLHARAQSRAPPLVCLRRPDLGPTALLELAAGAACRIEGTGVGLVLHGDPGVLVPAIMHPPPALHARLGDAIAGLHVPAHLLSRLSARPIPESHWFGVSCHDNSELEMGLALGADYVFLGPVKPTASHPGKAGIGWETFSLLVMDLPLPVYAIGGLGPADLENAWAAGAQGIAAIRGLWPQ